MKRSLIHPGFFREMFRQLRAKGLVASLLLLGLNLVWFSVFITRDPIDSDVSHYDPRLMALPMLTILYIFAPVMVLGAYRWLMKRTESDFYHAIPLTRTQIYATTGAAILLWLCIALTSFAIVHAVLFTVFGLPINLLLYLCVFVNMLIAAVEIVAAFSIGAALCGRPFTAFFQSITMLFLPRLLLTAFWMLTEIDSGYTLPFSMILPFFNPEFNIAATPVHSLIYGINFANVPAMLYSLAYSAGLFVLGGVAFKKRRSELAEIPYASKALQIATRVLFGMSSLATVTVLLNIRFRYGASDDFLPDAWLVPLVLTSVLFGFIFYCLYELISSRKMKNVVKAMPGFVFCLALSAFFVFVPIWVGKARTPKAIEAESVQSYRFSRESTLIVPSALAGSETYPNYVLHHYTFSDAEGKALISAVSKDNIRKFNQGSINLMSQQSIIVNDGGLCKKCVSYEDYWSYQSADVTMSEQVLKICMNDAAFCDTLFAYPAGRITYSAEGLTPEEAKEVGRLFREEYEKLTPDQRKALFLSVNAYIDPDDVVSPTGLSISLYGSLGTENYTMSYRINELTPNAANAMLRYLNARNESAVRQSLTTLIDCMEHSGNADSQILQIGNDWSNLYNMMWDYDQDKYAAPKDAHPEAYEILKALSEAPITTDPSRCVTVTCQNYDLGSITYSLRTATAGFEADEALKAKIVKLLADYRQYDPYEFIIENGDIG